MTDQLKALPADQQAPDQNQREQAPDQNQREQALDITRSFVVQAPAGSGKTELLTQRYLKLLAAVDQPEQVLAITFTRAATAEMRKRILDQLEKAGQPENVADDSPTLELARAALLHSQQRQWHLQEQPQRLNIQTIDSLCLSIAHRTPLLARLGGTLRPTEDAEPLYSLAARRTLQRLGGNSPRLSAALEALLQVRDNNLRDCETLIAGMLAQRDQWQHVFPLGREIENWDEVRAQLEQPFRREIRRVLAKAHQLLSRDAVVAMELMDLANYACQGAELKNEIGLLAGLKQLPVPSEEFAGHWNCLTNLLLTQGDSWLKSVNRGHGFPAPPRAKNISPERVRKDQMLSMIERLQAIPGLLETLLAIRRLPPARYDEQQWELLRHLFTTLLHAVAELKVAFAEQNLVDFVELGIAADNVLRTATDSLDEAPTDLALSLSDRVRHLLVDEFQDTSRRQHQLLTSLLRGWEPGDGRTCFLVGDPMQSIYLFRQAEVELFTQLQQHGLNCDGTVLPFETLQLSTNFRSRKAVVEPLNRIFASIFGDPADSSCVRFTPSIASDDTPAPDAVHVHADFSPASSPRALEEKAEARQREATRVVEYVNEHLPAVALAAEQGREFTIAILVRARNHLALIAEALREKGISYRSVELETLSERQEIIDLTALTRALVHSMDRVAWLAVLRAPWCGLSLADLHTLAGNDRNDTATDTILDLLQARAGRLSPEGQPRAQHVLSVLQEAIRSRFRQPTFSSWIERTWTSLGGPHCVDAAGYENAQAYFRMLDGVSADGIAAQGEQLEQRLSRLFALPDPDADERLGVQLMTIHKAKGLGFDVVIVPGLDRPTVHDRQPLICWLERVPAYDASAAVTELLIAPIGNKGADTQQLPRWVQRQKDRREADERKRLLYVACTRARRQVHLLGTAVVNADLSLRPGDAQSLLSTAWPALQADFEAQFDPSGSFNRNQQTSILSSSLDHLPQDDSEPMDGLDLAASAAETSPEVHALPALTVRRLPGELPRKVRGVDVAFRCAPSLLDVDDPELFERPEGSREARALGTTVHALFERAAKMLQNSPADRVRLAISTWREQATAILRHAGVPKDDLEQNSRRAMQALEAALDDPVGRWILGPHPQALIETSWTGYLNGSLRTLRVDRIFRAGAEPLSDGDDCLWIVDYKTASRSPADRESFLAREQETYQEQLHSYGRVVRLSRGNATPLRLGLYYPFMGQLKYWQA